jgi:hypothetical protein
MTLTSSAYLHHDTYYDDGFPIATGYIASVENNLGFLYLKINYCKEAQEHLNRARHIFVTLEDMNALAQCDETRARVFLKERRHVEAEKAARALSVKGAVSTSGRPLGEEVCLFERDLISSSMNSVSVRTASPALVLSNIS